MNFFIDVFSPYYSNFFLFCHPDCPPPPPSAYISHTLSHFIYLHSLYYLLYYLRTQRSVRAILVAIDDAPASYAWQKVRNMCESESVCASLYVAFINARFIKQHKTETCEWRKFHKVQRWFWYRSQRIRVWNDIHSHTFIYIKKCGRRVSSRARFSANESL